MTPTRSGVESSTMTRFRVSSNFCGCSGNGGRKSRCRCCHGCCRKGSGGEGVEVVGIESMSVLSRCCTKDGGGV